MRKVLKGISPGCRVTQDGTSWIAGAVLEFLKMGMEMPPGSILFEDPPGHDLHRGLLSRASTPRRINALEQDVRQFCAEQLDPWIGTGSFDWILDIGSYMPMRTIVTLIGIPEGDQVRLRQLVETGLSMESEAVMPSTREMLGRSPRRSAPFSTGESTTRQMA